MMNFHIENFKCYYKADIPLNYLTVLAGANGNGKSTVIQALLMMRNAYEHRTEQERMVELNGPFCLSLGTTIDIIPVDAGRNSSMELSLSRGDEHACFTFPLSDEHADLFLNVSGQKLSDGYLSLPLFKNEFYYLNAERVGPRVSQSIKVHKYPNVGWQGEYCAQVISERSSVRDFTVDESRCYDLNMSRDVLTQTRLWMQRLFPGIVIQSETNSRSLSSQILITHNYTSGAPVLTTNVGFGVSYVLPVIVAGLIAESGSIMIVENPEAHLHPSAQTFIAEFLATVAQAGVYVIVETHSDHFINGVQIAVAEEKLENEKVVFDFINQKDGMHGPEVKPISISDKAELSEWPDGFFNQTQKDFARLYRLRRNE